MFAKFPFFRHAKTRNRDDDAPSTPSPPPIFLAFRSSGIFIVITICIAIFTDIFLYACIVPVMPFALRTRVGVPESDIQHQVSVLLAVYGAALLAGSPLCGLLSDRMPNRRLPLLLGLLALGGATLLLCFGPNLAALLAARVLQGLSAAVVWTVGLALLADTFRGTGGIGHALGYVSLSMSLAILVAPMLGGIVYDRAGYYSVYYMCFGMIILDVILRLVLIEKKVARQWLPDENQIEGDEAPEAQAEVKEEKVAAEKPTVTSPVTTEPTDREIPPSSTGNGDDARSTLSRNLSPDNPSPVRALAAFGLLLSSRRLLSALVLSLISALLLTAWDATLPLYVNHLFGWSSIGGGLIFLPLIIMNLLAPVVGWWADKHGPRGPVILGFFLACPFVILLRLVTHDGIRQIVLLCALLALTGLALMLSFTPLEAEISYVVAEKEKTHPGAFGGSGAYATAYGLFNTAFAGGMLVGPLWGGLVVGKAGWGTMCWTLGLLSFVAAVVSFCFVGGGIGLKKRRRKGANDAATPV